MQPTGKRRPYADAMVRFVQPRAAGDSFAIKEWLAADGDTRDAKDAGLH